LHHWIPAYAGMTTLKADYSDAPFSELRGVAARAGAPSAPGITVTVASFRTWRGSRLDVAKIPTRATID